MTDERIKILEKALKLKELATRGIDGEKDTAKRMFDAWKEKHGITEYELASSSFEKGSEFVNMTAEEFFKHIEVDLRMLGFSMVIYAIGKVIRNEYVADAGMNLFREAVKQREEQKKEQQEEEKENE